MTLGEDEKILIKKNCLLLSVEGTKLEKCLKTKGHQHMPMIIYREDHVAHLFNKTS